MRARWWSGQRPAIISCSPSACRRRQDPARPQKVRTAKVWVTLGPPSHRRWSAGRCLWMLCACVCVCVSVCACVRAWLIYFAHCKGNLLASPVLLSLAFSLVFLHCICVCVCMCVCVCVRQLEFHSAGLSLCSPASNNELCLCTAGAILTQEHAIHRS